ncbi:MAG TPA: LuxR C-terminal-related transcriptional regulator [Cytophagales bacterium]
MQTLRQPAGRNPSGDTPPATDSFQDLTNLWQRQPYCAQAEESSLPVLLHANPALKRVLNAGPCLSWILNVRTGQYAFVSENAGRFLGCPTEAFIEGGLAFTRTLVHPADAPRLWKLVKQLWEALLLLPAGQREVCQLNYDYRLRQADSTYLRVLEQSVVLDMDPRGNVTHLLGMCTNITHWKKGDVLTANLTANEAQKCLLCLSSEAPGDLDGMISKQEKKVLRLVAEGYTSKQIANQLFISLHTVNTHRRNILEKTRSKNTRELIGRTVARQLS